VGVVQDPAGAGFVRVPEGTTIRAGPGLDRGDTSPFHITKQRVMLKATYSEADIYETWQLVALVELSPLGKCWYLVSQKRLVSTSRVGESEAISYVLLCVRAERPC